MDVDVLVRHAGSGSAQPGVDQAIAVFGATRRAVAQLERGAALGFEELQGATGGAAADAGAIGHVLGAGGVRTLAR